MAGIAEPFSTWQSKKDADPILLKQLLPQIERQLLLLCQSKANSNILAYAHVYGHQDYSCHPFVPIGMEALVHNQPHNCRLFAQSNAEKHLSLAPQPNTISVGSSGR
jgi:hypothetical protein